uniref:Polyol transporter 4 n=1 Tax=Hirondellea gigas TaxID=1518452 RepID=A0A6A7G7L9_9CRUS
MSAKELSSHVEEEGLLDQPSSIDDTNLRPALRFLYVLTALASLGAILLGYDVGVMSGAILFIEPEFNLTTFETEIIVSSLNLISLFGALFAGKFSDSFGRKKTIAIASVIFIAASVLMALANGFWMLLVGRLIAGLGVGAALVLPPIYIAEISPARFRGKLVTFSEICQNIGILLGYISGYSFANLPDNINWRVMLGLGVVPAIMMLLSLLIMPESPRWLVKEGRLEEAETTLRLTFYDDEVNDALASIEQALKEERILLADVGWMDLLRPTPAVKLMLIAGVGAAFFQQASGSEAAVYYTPKILAEAGIEGERNAIAGAIVVGAFKTTTLIIASLLLDKIGRRPMMITSTIVVMIALSLLGMSFMINAPPFAMIGGMCLYMIGFGIGLGPVGWLLIAEIFPLQLRGRAMAIGTAVNRLVSGTVALTFLSLSESISQAGAFFMYSGIAFCALIFSIVFIPETTNKTLEELIVEFQLAASTHDLSVIRKRKRIKNSSLSTLADESSESLVSNGEDEPNGI